MNYISQIRKAVIPVVVTGVLGLLAMTGIGQEMTVTEALTTLITAGLVWLIPNKQN